MELLYIWVDSYKNIHRQGFNFSPLYDFEFKITNEENSTITGELIDHKTDAQRKELETVYNGFFGKGISNVTAIIGQNGSGKSGVLEYICENINEGIIPDLALFKYDKTILCITRLNILNFDLENEYIRKYAQKTVLHNLDFIYYTNL